MSVVGPRPQLVRDMVFMTPEQRMRHTAKPGLSGLAQVNGRNAISWEDKLEWDQKYIKKVSLFEDIKIILACDEKDNLINTFNAYNTLIHMLSTICFSTAAVSIFNFISVYIKDVSDANYIQHIFGLLIISAEFVYCLRMPYNSIIYAAGKFKETKIPAGIEAGLNIMISCCLVPILGLSGVAIGTLVAMIYRCCSFVLYLTKDVLFIKMLPQVDIRM